MQDKKECKKNVLLMVPLLDQGGLERICALTAKLLKEKHNVTLVVFSTKNMLYDVSGVELIDLDMGSRPGKIGKVINVCKRVSAVKKIKKQKQTEVTYSFGPTANLVNVLSRVKDKIWVGIRGYGALADTKTMKLFCRRADKVICCTEVMADDIRAQFAPKEAVCLYNPCDTEQIRELSKAEVEKEHEGFFEKHTKIIASMSRADDVKGFWHQIKAFSLIKKEEPNAGLLLVGDGDFSEYKKLAKELEIEESVLFAGLQKNPFRYLKKADLYWLTSHTEGFPNSLIEAMATGVPAMAVNCKTGPAEILTEDYKQAGDQHGIYEGEYGVLLPVLNSVKNLDATVIEEEERILAREALRVLKDEGQLKKRREKAMHRGEFFSKEEYLYRLCELL